MFSHPRLGIGWLFKPSNGSSRLFFNSLLAPHYKQMDLDLVTTRVTLLVGTFVESIKRGVIPFVSYVQEIAEERISEGFFLGEIQLALSILEGQVWELVISQIPVDEQVARIRGYPDLQRPATT